MAKITRRDFLKMAGVAGVGMAALGGVLGWRAMDMSSENPKLGIKSSPYTWVRFFAGPNETALNPLTSGLEGHLYRYRVREVVPVIGEVPPNLMQISSAVRIETSIPPTFSEESLLSGGSSVVQFHGVRQNLHYTNDVQRQELDKASRSELEPSDHTTAVLIPIAKSDEWWKLAQDQRQSYFQKTDTHAGHTAIGFKYVDRVFRKLYHSRYLDGALGYDFLTYFEFDDVYAKDFRTLLAELRDPTVNPEWVFVNREFEIWMTKIG